MPGRRSRSHAQASNGTRERLAHEAARMMAESGIEDFGLAKRKAAERLGVRGAGEVPLVPPMAAIANAIHNAIGVRMTRLPMSPGAVLAAVWAKG